MGAKGSAARGEDCRELRPTEGVLLRCTSLLRAGWLPSGGRISSSCNRISRRSPGRLLSVGAHCTLELRRAER